jgi:two-component system, NtrC family, sensor kinase
MTIAEDDAVTDPQLIESLRQQRDAALAREAAMVEVLGVINRSPDDQAPVFHAILEKAVRLCEADCGQISTFDGARFGIVATRDVPPAFAEYRMQDPPGYSPDEQPAQLRAGALIHIADLMEEDAYKRGDLSSRALVDLGGARTSLMVPLCRDDILLGSIHIYRQKMRPFSNEQIALLSNYAVQAVIAMENTRLHSELQARTADLQESLEQQAATADVLRAISRTAYDLDTVLTTLISTALRLCGAPIGQIVRRHGEIYRFAASNMRVHPDYTRHEQQTQIRPGRGTLIGRVALENKPVQIEDAWNDPEYQEKALARLAPARAMLGVPLMRDSEPIGAFALARSEAIPFTERQVALVTTFADQAVIAIENVRLFDEVRARTSELAQSLADLGRAQERLVQSEKMASLGQLTAGIAHEIKNPLNFINNFSELSTELIDELQDVLATEQLSGTVRTEVNDLTALLKGNLKKVVQHGKRADGIIKNMLLHSRETGGEQRRVDLNATVEEALNLAYHGARAEKPGFNIILVRHYDPAAGSLELYPQEFTRVVLNLISNGFYAATRRKAETDDPDFEPTLSVTTEARPDDVAIRIRDNGIGIPEKVQAHMFEPFFTTKPTGEGTGLGLSLSHDIVVRQHRGAITVDSRVGAFTEVTVTLPRGAPFHAESTGDGQ